MAEKTWQHAVIDSFINADTDFLTLGDVTVHVMRSRSDPNDFHYILQFPLTNELVCAKCRGFRYRSNCDHVERARKELAF